MTTAPQELEQRVTRYVQAGRGRESFVTECTNEAIALVDREIGSASVPDSIRDRAVVEVAADLFHRQASRGGVLTFDAGESGVETVRVGLDPLRAARPMLSRWTGPVIA